MFTGPYQNETSSDGIRDTPHIFSAKNQDRYPLMGKITSFSVPYEEETYYVDVISNSSVSNFHFDVETKSISFNVTESAPTTYFCRVTIPYTLLEHPYNVTVDGLPPTLLNEIPNLNNTYIMLYFTYSHVAHEVTIIPEFSPTSVLLLSVVLVATSAMLLRKAHKNRDIIK